VTNLAITNEDTLKLFFSFADRERIRPFSLVALNLDETCGFATGSPGHMMSGMWDTRKVRNRPASLIINQLNQLRDALGVSHLLVKSPKKQHGPKYQRFARLLKAVLQWAEAVNLPHAIVDVGVIRKATIGNGNASDAAMVDECIRRGFWPYLDEADAIGLLDLGVKKAEEVGLIDAATVYA
jgi:hypothetical protein